MNHAKKKELIDEIAELGRESMSYETILVEKYHIMITYFFGKINRKAHEQKVANLKITRPDLTYIPLENRSELPDKVCKDEELDGMADCFDRLEAETKQCLIDKEYADLADRGNFLIFLYEKIILMASTKNTEAIRKLLSMEHEIYYSSSFDTVVTGEKVNSIIHKPQKNMKSWPKKKRDVYDLLDYLLRGMELFKCSSIDELRECVHALANSDLVPSEMSDIIKYSAKNIDGLLKSDMFARIVAQDHLFIAIANLASMGLGEKILYLLDQEDHLYELPVSKLNGYIDQLEKRVGLL